MQTEITIKRDAVNLDVLVPDLRAAIPIIAGAWHDGSNVTIVFDEKPTDEQIAEAQQLVESHDPAAKTPEQTKAEQSASKIEEARSNAGKIPAWATMTEAEAAAFIQSNVTDLASAKVALIALARIVVHLRDAQWPDLGEEKDAERG